MADDLKTAILELEKDDWDTLNGILYGLLHRLAKLEEQTKGGQT